MDDRHIKLKDAIEVVRETVADEYIESTLELRLLDKSLTADAVEVVRCKDCIYKEECGREVLVNEYDDDKAVDITGFLFYCSYGERKDT